VRFIKTSVTDDDSSIAVEMLDIKILCGKKSSPKTKYFKTQTFPPRSEHTIIWASV